MSLDPALRSRIDTLLADNRIVLFMRGQPQAPQCGFSAKAVGALNSLGIDYKHVDVLADPEINLRVLNVLQTLVDHELEASAA